MKPRERGQLASCAAREPAVRAAMNILYATDFHTRANSGITFAVNELARQTLVRLSPRGSVNLVSIGASDVAIQEGVRHHKVEPSAGPARLWRFARSYGRICDEAIRRDSISLAHIHGLWMHPQFAAARAAQRLAVPTVLTSHGAVQWAMRQPGVLGAAKKRLYMNLMKDSLFRKITIQHAITQMERDALHSFFPHARIEIVPNFVDVQEVDRVLRATPPYQGEPYLLYLGRLHPTKGVDILIEAFGRADSPRDWRLVVVGPAVEKPYADHLLRLIATSPRADRIAMREAVWDSAAKYRLMRDAWATIVPSYTEVISLVNLEASACSCPTITTKATGLADWTEGGGLLIEPVLNLLIVALSDAARWSDEERKQRGLASRKLIEQRYSAAAVMPRWLQLYGSIH